jgi:DNA-binding response OmpR family regulator
MRQVVTKPLHLRVMYSNDNLLFITADREDFREMFNQTYQLNANTNSSSKLICIVEDDEEIGNLLLQIIEQETIHKAIHHVNARNALDALARTMPHLLLIDYSLPDMNGLELYDWLQSFEHLKHISTILMSARNPPLEEIHRRSIIFLRKPFAVTELLAIIKKLFANMDYQA